MNASVMARIDRSWRLAATGAAFMVFGACGVLFSVVVFPFAWLWPHRASSQRVVATVIHWFFRALVALLEALGGQGTGFDDGVITVAFAANGNNGVPTTLDGKTMTLTPQIRIDGAYTEIDDGMRGSLDWACASTTHATATARGMLYTTGTLPAKYLPSECR